MVAKIFQNDDDSQGGKRIAKVVTEYDYRIRRLIEGKSEDKEGGVCLSV